MYFLGNYIFSGRKYIEKKLAVFGTDSLPLYKFQRTWIIITGRIQKMSNRITPKDLEDGEDLDFTESKEGWNVYKLEDGTTLKVKLVLRSVKRLKKWNPDGTPLYLIQSANVVRVLNVPKELRAKPKVQTFKPV